jgi:Leucine-rich repeat (LRR) protein
MTSDEERILDVHEDERDPDYDVDILFELKPLLPSAFTQNWTQGLRVISLQADNWNGLLARQCSVVKLNMSKWGLQTSLAQLVPHFREMHSLESLTLDENFELTGSLVDLAPLVNLRVLSLSLSPQIDGSLSNLSGMTNLCAIFLEGTRVTGSLGDLGACQHLTVLALAHTEITGSLDAVAPRLPELRWLLLSGTQVSG